MRVLPAFVLLFASVLLTAACAPAQPAAAAKSSTQPQALTVTATEMAFSPTTMEVQAGRPVTLTVRNSGMVEHNWQAQVAGEAIMLTVQPRQSASKTFTPQTPGTYKVVCSVPGHEQAGMVATLIVR